MSPALCPSNASHTSLTLPVALLSMSEQNSAAKNLPNLGKKCKNVGCLFCPDVPGDVLPRWLSGKDLTCNAGNTGNEGSIPESGRSPGVRNGNPLQYSCLGNPRDRGAWWATVMGSQNQARLSTHTPSEDTQPALSSFGDAQLL